MPSFRFTQWCCWRIKSPGMWRSVVGEYFTMLEGIKVPSTPGSCNLLVQHDPQVLRSYNPSIHEDIHAHQHSATCQKICTIQSSHDSSQWKQWTDLVVMLVGQRTSPEWYSILHMYGEAVAESILHQAVMLLLLQCHTDCRKCCDDRRRHKTGRLLFFTFCCSCRCHGITKTTVEYAWNTAMMVRMVTVAVVLVAAASTKFAITFHILTHTDKPIRYNSIPLDITVHNCTTYENLTFLLG